MGGTTRPGPTALRMNLHAAATLQLRIVLITTRMARLQTIKEQARNPPMGAPRKHAPAINRAAERFALQFGAAPTPL